jgi:CO/xanthine dehydrogenase FAD-binding subunit
MTALVPGDLAALVDVLAETPGAQLLAGGTDFMVEVNFGHRVPEHVVALHGVDELRGWTRDGDALTLRSGLTYTEMQGATLAALVPALAQAARTVGSPQIRNVGTLGGNLGTASPAGDTLPVLAALDAVVLLASRAGVRRVPFREFMTGPKRTVRAADEVVIGVQVLPARGPQEFVKVGTRNAMVIAVASVALVVDPLEHTVACALGAVGPVVLRAGDAEQWIADRIDWDELRLDAADAAEFASRAAAAARPIDDHRSTAAYRRRAIEVCARRAALRALPGS